MNRTVIVALLCGMLSGAQAQTDWVAHYHRRVSEFQRENRSLDPSARHVVLVGDSLTEAWGGADAQRATSLGSRGAC